MPTLSIIIPTCNSSRYIERCLRSITNQTFTDYEILIQDGNSVDGTMQVIAHVQQANPGIEIQVKHEPDGGIYDAMNKAVRRARGEWLYFLGSDDELYSPEVLSTVMASRYAPLADVLYGNVKVIGNARWATDGAVYDGLFDLRKFLNKNICHQSLFYRADFFRSIGSYNQSYVVCADWDFNMRCWAKTTFRYLDLVVAKFHAGGTSTQTRSDERFAAEVAANVLCYFNFPTSAPEINTPDFVGYQGILNMREPRRVSRRTLGAALKTWARRLAANRES